MKCLFLLRSYGDFIIALNFITKYLDENDKIVASSHLKPLYDAVLVPTPSPNIIFTDFKINKGLLSYFTWRHLPSKNSIVELKELLNYIRGNKLKETIFFEKKSVRNRLISALSFRNIYHVHQNNNVYEEYGMFFKTFVKEKTIPLSDKSMTIKKILILPDSRKKSKSLSSHIIDKLKNSLSGIYEVSIGIFSNSLYEYESDIKYSDFKSLVELIRNADFLICSDSLPVHIAYYYDKPHFCIYKHEINVPWLTPYCSEHKSYCVEKHWETIPSFIKANF